MRIRVLGPVQVEHEGETLAVGGPQQRRLLAYLVIHRGRTVSTDALIDALWPDGEAPDGAARSMRTYLSRLRVVLPDGAIASRRSGYELQLDGIDLDVVEFDSLADRAEHALPDGATGSYDAALALWRGRPFGEFSDEWWAIPESTRLVERRAAIEEGRASALMAMGHHNRAIPELERLVAEQPLRERPVRLLMQGLHVTGRRAEGLRVAAAFRTCLAEETGLEPSRELADLESVMLLDGGQAVGSSDRPLRGYAIHEAIGEGAHGRVYAATQPGTDRPVAIKVIRPDLADSTDFVRRFEAEARLIARLEHPHIVPLYDYWREPGGAYLVFRLLRGGTARDSVVTGGAWSLPRVSRFVEEIAGALMAAHAKGVTHNDVKASNVLLDENGAAYLIDFGIAATDDVRDTADGQLRDVRDFAWLAWELLTGERRPLDAARSTGPVPSLVGRVASVPDGLEAVLTRGAIANGGFTSVAELLLAWRAATGQPDGAPSPITSSERRAVDAARRVAALQMTLSARAGVNPYRGLRPFEEGDDTAFHGREGVVDELFDRLACSPLVTVVGASGSGKSSVVRAGLGPRLRQAGAVVVTMVPGEVPLGALRDAISEVATADDDAESTTCLQVIRQASRRLGRLVVVVDQFEECWTRAGVDEREAFLDVLAASIDDGSIDVRFVATMRADLLDRPLEHPRLGQRIGSGAFVLPPLSPAELESAIVLPAAAAGVSFDPGVVADLIAESITQPGSLPLLQFTLTELYDRRLDGVIGRAALETIGGMAGAIARKAEEIYVSLDDDGQADARALFARLLTPGQGAPDTRRRAPLGELLPGIRAVAGRYVDARLLVTDRDPATREPTIEVAHEALLARWPRLGTWLDEDRHWLVRLQHLSTAARAWDDANRGDAELYRGARLEAAIEALDVEHRSVSPVERAFVESGRRARDRELDTERRRVKRLRLVLVATSVLAAVAIALGAIAVVQRNEARDARSAADQSSRDARIEALVGRSESLRSTQRDVAALLAIEAYRLADTPRTRSALFATFTNDEHFLDAHHFEGERGTSGIVMPDGRSAFLTDQRGRLHRYDIESGDLGDLLPQVGSGQDRFPVLVASEDGRLLVQAARADPSSGPTSVGVIDTETGSLTFPAIEVAGVVTSAAFLAGNRLALSIGEAGGLLVVDVGTGAEVATLPGADVADEEIIWTLDPKAGANGRFLRRPAALALTGNDLLLGAADGSLRIIDPETIAVRRTLTLAPETLSTLWPLADGSVVTSGRKGFTRVNLGTGKAAWTETELDRCVNLVVFEQRGVLFCGDPYGRLDERDLRTGAVTRTLDAQNGNSGSLWSAADGIELVSFGNNEPVVSRWRLDGSGPITRAIAPGWRPYNFNHTGDLLLIERGGVFDGDYEVGVIDSENGTVPVAASGLFVPGWSDADTLFGFAVNADGAVERAHIDLDNGVPAGGPVLDGFIVHDAELIAANELDTGKERELVRYRVGEQNSLLGFDIASQRPGPRIPVEGLVGWAISRSGHRIVAGTTRGIVVYDTDTGAQVGAIPDTDLRGAFVTVTDQLFVSSLGGELIQYDLETLEPIRTLAGSRGFVSGGFGTADGSLIATFGGDRTVSLYDVATGTALGSPLAIAADELNTAKLSIDGRWLTVGGEENKGDHAIQLWDLQPASWEAAACRLAGRNLTSDEWDATIGDLAPFAPTCSEFV